MTIMCIQRFYILKPSDSGQNRSNKMHLLIYQTLFINRELLYGDQIDVFWPFFQQYRIIIAIFSNPRTNRPLSRSLFVLGLSLAGIIFYIFSLENEQANNLSLISDDETLFGEYFGQILSLKISNHSKQKINLSKPKATLLKDQGFLNDEEQNDHIFYPILRYNQKMFMMCTAVSSVPIPQVSVEVKQSLSLKEFVLSPKRLFIEVCLKEIQQFCQLNQDNFYFLSFATEIIYEFYSESINKCYLIRFELLQSVYSFLLCLFLACAIFFPFWPIKRLMDLQAQIIGKIRKNRSISIAQTQNMQKVDVYVMSALIFIPLFMNFSYLKLDQTLEIKQRKIIAHQLPVKCFCMKRLSRPIDYLSNPFHLWKSQQFLDRQITQESLIFQSQQKPEKVIDKLLRFESQMINQKALATSKSFRQLLQTVIIKMMEISRLFPLIIIKLILEMRFKERDQSSVRGYQRISLGKRKRLVELVVNEGQPLSKIVKKLKIKLTTARLIITKYKQTGEFPMRDFKKRAIRVHNQPTRRQQPHQSSLEQSGHSNLKPQNNQPAEGQFGPQGLVQNSYTFQYLYLSPLGYYVLPYGYN